MMGQRWIMARAGRIGRMRLEDSPLPLLDPGCVRVGVRAVGLNFADVFAVLGLYSATPRGPFTPGLEFAGAVEGVGEACSPGLHVGDAVMGVTRFGGYASHVDVPPVCCLPLPTGWDFVAGAAFPVQTLTAWHGLRSLGNVGAGQSVLIHSAAGGVGLQAMAICRRLGARPVGTVRSLEKQAFLASRGFGEVVVRPKSGRIVQPLNELLGDCRFDCVLDGIGGRVQRDSFALLAPGGRLVVFGAAEFMRAQERPAWLHVLRCFLNSPRFRPLDLISGNKSILAFNLIWLWEQLPQLRCGLEEMLSLGLDAPHVADRFPFAEAPSALRRLQSGDTVGKVVLLLDGAEETARLRSEKTK